MLALKITEKMSTHIIFEPLLLCIQTFTHLKHFHKKQLLFPKAVQIGFRIVFFYLKIHKCMLVYEMSL